MYINEVNFESSPVIGFRIRQYLQQFYNQSTVGELANMISERIPCNDTSYSVDNKSIVLSIKKSAAKGSKKKLEIFTAMHYYGILSEVFKEFFQRHKDIEYNITKSFGEYQIYNLFDVQCLGDKTVIIHI